MDDLTLVLLFIGIGGIGCAIAIYFLAAIHEGSLMGAWTCIKDEW